jgi:hypothetical protein
MTSIASITPAEGTAKPCAWQAVRASVTFSLICKVGLPPHRGIGGRGRIWYADDRQVRSVQVVAFNTADAYHIIGPIDRELLARVLKEDAKEFAITFVEGPRIDETQDKAFLKPRNIG